MDFDGKIEFTKEVPQTDFEVRTKYVGIIYDEKTGKRLEHIPFNSKKDAKEYLQNPRRLGKRLVLLKEVTSYEAGLQVTEVL